MSLYRSMWTNPQVFFQIDEVEVKGVSVHVTFGNDRLVARQGLASSLEEFLLAHILVQVGNERAGQACLWKRGQVSNIPCVLCEDIY